MQAQHGYSVARIVRGAHETNAIPVWNVFAINDRPKVGDNRRASRVCSGTTIVYHVH